MPGLKSALIVFLVAMTFASACSRKEDADLVREVIQEGVERAEAHQIGDLLKLATQDFIALPGRYNRRSVKGVLFAAFRHYGQFKINYPWPTVEMDSNGLEAQATIYFLIVSKSRPLPGLKALYHDPQRWIEVAAEKADLYQLKLKWIKHDGGWKVRQAALEGFKGTGF